MELSLMTFMLEFPVLFFKPGTLEEKTAEIESYVALTAKTGFKNIDMVYQTIQLIGKEKIKEMLDKYGLKLTCIIYLGVAENDEFIPDAVEACEFFGCKRMMLVPGNPSEDRKEAFDIIVKNFNRAVKLAAEKGVICVCEDDPDIKIPCATREELDALLEAVPGLKVVYDSGNMYPVCDTALPYFEYFKDRIAHFHLKDTQIFDTEPEGYSNPTIDGRYCINAPHFTGIIDFEELIAAIKASGYEGILAVELVPMPGMDLEEDMKRVYDRFSQLVP